MVDIKVWMGELAEKLTGRFGDRLLFLGLQGSYGRGEAGEDSDIDVVTVLDRVELADLDEYRAAVRGMPEGEKACGFLCGAAELKSWPKYDLCQLARDVRAYRGELGPLLPPLGREDLAQAAAIGASGIYHAAVHTYLYAPKDNWPGFLKEAHKGAFFALRALYELRTGESVRAKRDLLPRLSGDEREILAYSLLHTQEEPEATFARLLRWSAAAMAGA
ncbi:MAG: nucleotidyltransferase domain-containing protein [Oscillospiraceae bacterium]|nr:nucleotidyltransferase domain-containing protein [Oscillospiraceae bacterium]MCI9549967.1 nucleotidyltransferase domain-containing protein [Oscillospiraceae bacterium]